MAYASKEKELAKRREHYRLNREASVAKTKKWQKANPEKVKATRKKWKEKNPNYREEYYKKYPEKFKAMRFKSLMWRIAVKMTYEEFKQLLKKQKNRCAICGKIETKRRISVDHDHKTGKVRGLLCQLCNTSLGGFQDNPKLLKKAIKYLNQK